MRIKSIQRVESIQEFSKTHGANKLEISEGIEQGISS
jgi:hypothetical protein